MAGDGGGGPVPRHPERALRRAILVALSGRADAARYWPSPPRSLNPWGWRSLPGRSTPDSSSPPSRSGPGRGHAKARQRSASRKRRSRGLIPSAPCPPAEEDATMGFDRTEHALRTQLERVSSQSPVFLNRDAARIVAAKGQGPPAVHADLLAVRHRRPGPGDLPRGPPLREQPALVRPEALRRSDHRVHAQPAGRPGPAGLRGGAGAGSAEPAASRGRPRDSRPPRPHNPARRLPRSLRRPERHDRGGMLRHPGGDLESRGGAGGRTPRSVGDRSCPGRRRPAGGLPRGTSQAGGPADVTGHLWRRRSPRSFARSTPTAPPAPDRGRR